MVKEKILLLGGGGHCKSVIEAIESERRFEIAGILDSLDKIGQKILGYSILGTDPELADFVKNIPNVIITVGQLEDGTKREHLYKLVKSTGANLPVVIASSAQVSKHARIAEGSVILHQATVNANAVIGVNTIINTSAIIEHDAAIGDHCHISTGAVINGNCTVGNRTLIGSNAVLKHGVGIEKDVVVGAGAVVINNVREHAVVAGNPAKEINK